jgi:hypothetical protein
LLREVTRFVFSGDRHSRQIDRTTTFTALVPVTFHDRKDGLLGMRVASALEMPSTPGLEAMTGNRSGRPLNPSSPANGNYLSSTGLQGDSVWGSRARWCMLYGSQGSETESITIFDHPGNPGYPTYWHAANPLAPSAFDKKADSMNFHLDTGAAATFRYRILITDGRDHPRAEMLNRIADDFGKQ